MSHALPTLFQQQIHVRHYARWIEEKNRREHWPETVDRYMSQAIKQVQKHGSELTLVERAELRDGISNARIMPSMRALMTAGPALERDNVAGYNCAYVAIDDPRAFDETLYILCCGTGVGFSVEKQHVAKMPTVRTFTDQSFPLTIVVGDSKEGWASAFGTLIDHLYAGKVPKVDYSKIRPSGAKLKTFGGRASGPQPLIDLFEFCIDLFRNAQGRQLSTTECHEIMCKIGDIVVVGGVRRSALISLYSPDDEAMTHIKSGEWWVDKPHLRLANNSAAWTYKPDNETFHAQQWGPLVEGKSGEPGIINRAALRRKAESTGRREDAEFGTNPCVTGDTWTMTDEGPRQVADLLGHRHGSVIHGVSTPTTEDGFWKNGVKEVLHLATKEGYSLRLTENHKILRVRNTAKSEYEEWVTAGELNPGDRIKLHNHREFLGWPGEGNYAEGWLLGELRGDGNYSGNQAQVKFWGDSRDEMQALALSMVRDNLQTRSDCNGHDTGTVSIITCVALKQLAYSFGMGSNKEISTDIERASSEFTRGFLRGLFDADGSVQGTQQKGVSVRLAQSDLTALKTVQRMLLRLGIASTIYEERYPEGYREMPDGNGGLKNYWCRATHELVVANDNLFAYQTLIGFYEPAKSALLDKLLGSYKRKPNRERFYATVSSLISDGEEMVYDCSVPGPNAFDANGLYVHNCGEIILNSKQFCNLTEVVARVDDTFEDLIEKVRLSTILGTIQSSFTDFRYIRPEWKENCERERLLGVSITGAVDNPILNGSLGEAELRSTLHALKHVAIDTNKEWAARLGINQSVSITCNKPSGTVAQLVLSGPGMNEWHDKRFIRRIRGSKTDPASQLLYFSGVHTEDDVMDPTNTWVFSFPITAPKGALTREDMPALKKLRLWLAYAEAWCEHNPSTTINVKEEEWEEVGEFVYENFDKMAGVAFLPFSDHTYQQAPYESVSDEEFDRLVLSTPTTIDWTLLSALEKTDHTTGSKELACVSGACDIDMPAAA
jgi:ribonucleotide reductase class II